MRRFFNGLVVGIVLGVAGYWFVQTKSREHPEAQQRYEAAASQAHDSATETAGHLSDAFKAKMDALDLRADQIKDELARTGKIVRRKAQDLGQTVVDEAADARIVTAIKAIYAVDRDLSVWQISVSSTQGHVTLSGTVPTPDDIGKAVALALEVDGVHDVSSTLQVKNNGLAAAKP
jgi:osmotically-inducible protein OsmY